VISIFDFSISLSRISCYLKAFISSSSSSFSKEITVSAKNSDPIVPSFFPSMASMTSMISNNLIRLDSAITIAGPSISLVVIRKHSCLNIAM